MVLDSIGVSMGLRAMIVAQLVLVVGGRLSQTRQGLVAVRDGWLSVGPSG